MAEKVPASAGDARSERNLDELLGTPRLRHPRRDSKVDKWCRWLDAIDQEVTTIWLNRTVWQGLNEIVRQNGRLPASHFLEFLAQTYVTSQAAAIRRQAEADLSRVVSLGGLLTEIAEEPQLLSRALYVWRRPPGEQWLGHRTFDEEFAHPGDDHIDPSRVCADKTRLEGAAAPIKRYVDHHIAHYDRKRKLEEIPTFPDLDAAIDTLGLLLQRYLLLLKGLDRDQVAPAIAYDWTAPFRVPWISR